MTFVPPTSSVFLQHTRTRGVSQDSLFSFPGTVLLWISSFYDLSLNHNLNCTSFYPWNVLLLTIVFSQRIIVVVSSKASDITVVNMPAKCTFSVLTLFLSQVMNTSTGCLSDRSKLVCQSWTTRETNQWFVISPTQQIFTKYLPHTKHSRHQGGALQTWIKSESAPQGSCNIVWGVEVIPEDTGGLGRFTNVTYIRARCQSYRSGPLGRAKEQNDHRPQRWKRMASTV